MHLCISATDRRNSSHTRPSLRATGGSQAIQAAPLVWIATTAARSPDDGEALRHVFVMPGTGLRQSRQEATIMATDQAAGHSVASISGYHAHVYYDAATKAAAAEVREAVERRFKVTMGRWHDAPIGPHPSGSYQIAFAPERFGELVPWLALNRRGLTVFVHPDTRDALSDHSAHVVWLGASRPLNLDVFR
jgi:aromatic ring-cleaving dioxygenase